MASTTNKELLVESIIPTYWGTDKKILKRCMKQLKKQSYKNHKITIANGNEGLAHAFNEAIKKSKADIVFLWLSDTYPETNDFIKIMVKELIKDKAEVVTPETSTDKNLWESFDLPTQILTEKETRKIISDLHEKGTGYIRETFYKYGFFDEETFWNAGEIIDLSYRWMKRKVRIKKVPLNVVHYHPETFMSRLRKEKQLGTSRGALYRKNFVCHRSLLKAVFPYAILRGIITPTEFKSFRIRFLYAPYINFLANIQYMKGFWKAFLTGKQNAKYK